MSPVWSGGVCSRFALPVWAGYLSCVKNVEIPLGCMKSGSCDLGVFPLQHDGSATWMLTLPENSGVSNTAILLGAALLFTVKVSLKDIEWCSSPIWPYIQLCYLAYSVAITYNSIISINHLHGIINSLSWLFSNICDSTLLLPPHVPPLPSLQLQFHQPSPSLSINWWQARGGFFSCSSITSLTTTWRHLFSVHVNLKNGHGLFYLLSHPCNSLQ